MTRKEREQFKHDNELYFCEKQDDKKEELKRELQCMEMIDSIICYGAKNIDLDSILNDRYMKSYIEDLGIKKVKKLIQGQLDEKPLIKYNTYTDYEGLTYNSMIYKDEEGYYE